ncbi:MAG: hypothetical protein IJX05_04660 [Clostridia bacterium]|nr:hypothetical protein [Clostridia bacterium]
MNNLLEINGTIEISEDLTIDQFIDLFIEFIERHDCFFGGGFKEIDDVNNSEE